MAWRPETRAGAVLRDCPRCGLPTYHQRSGLPFVVTTDAERLTPDEAAHRTGPNRLAWCLRESKWTGARLGEVHHRHCEFPHVVDHECTEGAPATPKPEGTLW